MSTPERPPRSRPPTWIWAVIAAIVIATATGIGFLAIGGDETPPEPQPTASPRPSPTQPTPEEQAAVDLEQLLRDYEAASNAAFLDPTIEPGPALDDYLRSPALDKDVEQIIFVHSPEGLVVESRAVEVHEVTVTALDLDADPPTATVQECRTITAAGTWKQSGELNSLNDDRRLVTWSALIVEDGRWRLFDAEPGRPGTC